MAKRIAVIGSGAAGMTAASSARERDQEAEITVFTEDEHVAYSPCAIPFVIEGRIKDFRSIVMHTPEWYRKERRIDVHVRTKVTGVDLEGKLLTLQDGAVIGFDSLILAPGGTVFVPPVEGVRLSGVCPVRWLRDGEKILSELDEVQSVAVAGAGVIGLEMAVALRHRGKEVTVVEMFEQAIPRLFDEDMARLVQAHCESLGIKFMMGSPLGSILGHGRVEGIKVASKEVPCQMLILATGVRPNLELANQIGLDIGPLGAVRVSASMQPYRKGRLVKDLYLAGDVVSCESAILPGPTLSQLGSSAVRQGRVAGINAAGGYAQYPGVASPFVSVIGEVQVGGVGMSRGLADYYGVKVAQGKAHGMTRARYYPGGKPLTVKVLADASTRKLIGAQIVGGEEVTGRINWIGAAIVKGVTAEEFQAGFENAYCPPVSMVRDVVNEAVDDLVANLR